MINQTCLKSGNTNSGQYIARYRGHKIGFCSATHRNEFVEFIAPYNRLVEAQPLWRRVIARFR